MDWPHFAEKLTAVANAYTACSPDAMFKELEITHRALTVTSEQQFIEDFFLYIPTVTWITDDVINLQQEELDRMKKHALEEYAVGDAISKVEHLRAKRAMNGGILVISKEEIDQLRIDSDELSLAEFEERVMALQPVPLSSIRRDAVSALWIESVTVGVKAKRHPDDDDTHHHPDWYVSEIARIEKHIAAMAPNLGRCEMLKAELTALSETLERHRDELIELILDKAGVVEVAPPGQWRLMDLPVLYLFFQWRHAPGFRERVLRDHVSTLQLLVLVTEHHSPVEIRKCVWRFLDKDSRIAIREEFLSWEAEA